MSGRICHDSHLQARFASLREILLTVFTGLGVIYLSLISLWVSGALFFDVARGKAIGWCLVAIWIFAVVVLTLSLNPLWHSITWITFAWVVCLALGLVPGFTSCHCRHCCNA